eukprot:GFYU01001393.1.p1 GENE.GFYU01001393.1~~GFYU01001393.1.p1  ORF type:complete len:197 (+),score=28.30 GFYU01001393.1:84-674(+)
MQLGSLTSMALVLVAVGIAFPNQMAEVQWEMHASSQAGSWVEEISHGHRADEIWYWRSGAGSGVAGESKVYGNILKSCRELSRVDGRTSDGWQFRVAKDDGVNRVVQLAVLTPTYKWVDLVDVRVHSGPSFKEAEGVVVATVSSVSTGVIPAVVPGSYILNMMLFWVPFSDHGKNMQHINTLRDQLLIPPTETMNA